MNLTDYALNELKTTVSGDNGLTPYQSGPQLVALFNSFGNDDSYGHGFPSRNDYVLKNLRKLNGSDKLREVFEIILSARHFRANRELDLQLAVDDVNIVIRDEGYELRNINDIYKIVTTDFNDDKTSEIHFAEIQQQIITELEKARYLIWVAVAWFTDETLYEILTAKRERGLNVQALILDDEINRDSGLNFGKDFYTLRVQKQGAYENIMHHKFCIIDLKTVIHGSYNWTNRARYNNETIDIETGRENAEHFADQFIHIKTL